MSDAEAKSALRALLATRDAREGPLLGWKVALNFPEVQRQLGLRRALAAPLGRDTPHGDGSTLDFAPSSKVHVEAELALALAEDVDAWRPVEELRRAVASYAPCLELVDYALPMRDLASMFAHRFFHAGLVLGSAVDAREFLPLPPELPKVVRHDGEARSPLGTTVPSDVVLALHALMELVLEAGGCLRRDEWILCGSYIDPLPLPAGASLRAEFGPQFGSLTLSRGR